jgi:Kdo2-lipid IVA lauroyltransferase/acyltransferase
MHKLSHYLFHAVSRLVFAMPWNVKFFIGDVLGFLWFDILRLRRKVVLNNLSIAFPNWSIERKIQVGRASVCHLGRSFVEFLMLPCLTRDWMEKNVTFHGLEHFQKAQKQGKGVLLLSLHVGNGDLGSSMMSLKGLPIYLITKRMSIRWVDNFWFHVRANHGTQFIEARDSTFDIFRALRNNAGVVFVLDQYAGPPIGMKTNFFGKETGTAYGLALFSYKTNAPVIPVYTYRNHTGGLNIVFEEEIALQKLPTRDETLSHMTQVYSDHLETIVRRHPEQWMWVHRRWKEFGG